MNSFGNNSKFLGNKSRQLFQVVRRNFVEQRGDEDIKWQWSVRESPCQECHKYKAKKGWLAKLFRRKQKEELTNRHKEVVKKPKIWEWDYYDYLLPECNIKSCEEKSKYESASKVVCRDSKAKECEGKRILVHLADEDHQYQKDCTEKLCFEQKEPFSLKEVSGKMNYFGSKSDTESCSEEEKKEKDEKKDDFCCLNNLIDENKEKTEDKSKKSQCD